MAMHLEWQRSKSVVLFFLLFFSAGLFSMSRDYAGASASVFQDDAGRLLSGEDGAAFYQEVNESLPVDVVEAYKSIMPPLLKGIHAYYKSPNSSNPERQVRSFHRFLLIGPPGVSAMAEAIAQDVGFEKIICNAPSLMGESYEHAAANIRSLFKGLRSEKRKVMLIVKNLDELFEGHPEKDYLFWEHLDYFEQQKPNVIIAISVKRADKFSQEMKSRFRVQYISIPNFELLALRATLEQDKTIEMADDLKVALNAEIQRVEQNGAEAPQRPAASAVDQDALVETSRDRDS